jgi:hypothetical protein
VKRTIPDHTPDGLRERLAKLERQAADERRRGDPPPAYVEVENIEFSGSEAGALLIMQTDPDALDAFEFGSDVFVPFSSVLQHVGWGPAPDPGAMWVHPVTGIYVATYTHMWWSKETGDHPDSCEVRLELGPPGGSTLGDAWYVHVMSSVWAPASSEGRGTVMYAAQAGQPGWMFVEPRMGLNPMPTTWPGHGIISIAMSGPTPFTAQPPAGTG